MTSSLPTGPISRAALLRRPGYPGFLLTVSMSRITGAMFMTAGVLFVLARTHSPLTAGLTSAAATLPAAVTGPLLGAWLDVAPSRRVLIVVDQFASVAALIGIIALAGRAPDWTVPAVAVLYSITRPLTYGSFTSALAEVAGAELLDHASAIESVSLNLSIVVGPAFAGVLAGATSPETALWVQIALTLVVIVAIARRPVFEIRPAERADTARRALSEGLRALIREPWLRATGVASTLAAFGWGLMMIGFPLYAARVLHTAPHASGYMWAAVAAGSIAGTFALPGAPSRVRIATSYGVLGLSALLWPLAHVLWLGVALIALTGFLEGPAYSGTISVRQRHAPSHVRAQVLTTLSGGSLVASSLGAAVAGVLNATLPAILIFVAINVLAAAAARWA